MDAALRFVALNVPDLQAAEAYYRRLFDMQLLMREAEGDDGLWYTLPPGKGWSDAQAAGVQLDMLALRRGDFVLPLFRGHPTPGQLFAIGLHMPPDEMAAVRARLGESETLLRDDAQFLYFTDSYGFDWQIARLETEFLSNGQSNGHWLDV